MSLSNGPREQTCADAPGSDQSFTISRLAAPFGAEITGLDAGKDLTDADFARIHDAYLHEHLLVLRHQRITPSQHIAFSRRFGKLMIHALHQFHLPGHPEILCLSNIIENGQPTGLGDAGRYWHSDISYQAIPSQGSLLHAQELPDEGGDTLFADMHLAYESLPQALRAAVEGKYAIHSYLDRYIERQTDARYWPALTPQQVVQLPDVLHPIVRTHPESGRKALFVNEGFTTRIEGMPADESAAVLRELFAHSVKPQHVYRHRWQDHDLLFWDNRSLVHLATGCPGHMRRRLYRTTIEGDVPR